MIHQQIFTIPVEEGKYLIYAPLKGIAFIANSSLVNLIIEQCHQGKQPSSNGSQNRPESRNNPLTIMDFLHKLNFFQPEPFPADECGNGTRHDAVILFLTNQCNLNCFYCYACSGEYPKKEMPWEIAKSAIDLVIGEVVKNKLPALTLGFHGGGEPTLNFNTLQKAVNYTKSLTKKKGISLHITGSFNGYWSKKVLRYITTNFTDISISFDGLPAVQNLQRPTRGKGESFSVVKETLHALDNAPLSYGIRMTVTKDSLLYLSESISYICENFKPIKIQVEPVFAEGRAKRNGSVIDNLHLFIEQFIKGHKKAEEHNITLFYSGARLEALGQRFCLCACRALVVTPEGDITTCFEVYGNDHPLSSQFIIGNYRGNGQFYINKERLHKHLSHTVARIQYCNGCFCKWHCGGDCAVKTHAGNAFMPTERCLLNQEITKYLILRKIQKNGGLIWARNLQKTE